jgi:FtsP/CotA-like multicopper oxidase with cupredoxin domain
MKITRREAFRLGLGVAAGAALPAIGAGVASTFGVFSRAATAPKFELPFAQPPVLQPARVDGTTDYYEVVQMQQSQEIIPGLLTQVWGYNGTLPGPTIRARSNRRVVIHQTNALPEPTSVHLHGGVQAPESDGYPTDLIPPFGSKDYVYPNLHRAQTLFYHDHAMDLTGPHIYKGLSGLYLIGDEVDDRLPLPKGDFDVPIVIQDRAFNSDGSFAYHANNPSNVFSEGGATVLINSVPWPRMRVAARRYRFRILNASNSQAYEIALSNRQTLALIATDGGLLGRPISLASFRLGPAERAEVVVDFGALALGTTLDLVDLVRFEVDRRADEDSYVPDVLDPTPLLHEQDATRTRNFVLRRTATAAFPPFRWTINGTTFNPAAIAAVVPEGAVEVWTFENRSFGPIEEMDHPVHIHLVNFLVLDRNGRAPHPVERGWKDTVVVRSNETVGVIARFGPLTGKYILHCHNLAHEDHAMMANFEVV